MNCQSLTAMGPVEADFDVETDNVYRSVSATDSQDVKANDPPLRLKTWPPAKASQTKRHTSSSRRFCQSHLRPREVPTDPFFRLLDTTLILVGTTPSEAANRLLDFLVERLIAVVRKINFDKFSIKAEAYVDGLSCLLKVKIFNQGSSLAVEFQRRSGDSAAFNCFFHAALEYMAPCSCKSKLRMPGLLMPEGAPKTALQPSCQVLADSFATLIELVAPTNSSRDPQLLAELLPQLLLVLTAAEESRQVVSKVMNDTTFEVFLNMLQTDRFNVCYPVSCVLLHLSTLPEVANLFTLRALKTMLGKLWVASTGPQVWVKLAQAVCNNVCDHAGSLTGEDARDLSTFLHAALATELPAGTVAGGEMCGQLEKSLHKALLLCEFGHARM